MKKFIIMAIIFCCILIGYVISHSDTTPQIAIRTYLFLSGHPISALTTGIVENQGQTILDRNSLERQNAKIYSLKRPLFDASGNYLSNYKVIKKGSQYYVGPYGEA